MRRRIRSSLLPAGLALLAVAAGCRESTVGPADAGTATQLVGRWVSSRNALSPEAWHQASLTFTIDGRFTSESRMYGLYERQQRDDLSAFTRIEGTYRIDRDRLIFEPQRLVWWDAFDGARSGEHVEEPYPWGGLFDDTRYSVRDDHLAMSFTIYPADAPVPTVAEYTRDRLLRTPYCVRFGHCVLRTYCVPSTSDTGLRTGVPERRIGGASAYATVPSPAHCSSAV